MQEQVNHDNNKKETETSQNGAISYYYNQLSSTKKWWSKSNSRDYNDVINGLIALNNFEDYYSKNTYSDKEKLDHDRFILYETLKEKCRRYLSTHSGFRWTSVGRKRYRLINALYDLLNELEANKLKLLKELDTESVNDIIPMFAVDNDSKERMLNRNKKYAEENIPIYGGTNFNNGQDIDNIYKRLYFEDWIHDRITPGLDSSYTEDENAVIESIEKELKNKHGREAHIGNWYKFDGLSINRIWAFSNHLFDADIGGNTDTTNDETIKNTRKSVQNLKIIFDNLLAGDEYNEEKGQELKADSGNKKLISMDDLKNDDERQNVIGIIQYKEVIYNQYKRLYD